MFDKLIRRVTESISKTHVGFLSEPTAIVAGDHRTRTVRVVSLDEWRAIDKEHGDDALGATVQRDSEGGHYAVVVAASSSNVTIVQLREQAERTAFVVAFVDDDHPHRTFLKVDLVKARPNPPPPPPPPGDEFLWNYVTRLDALVRVSRLTIVDPNFRNVELEINTHLDG